VIYLKPNLGLPTLLICGSSFFLFDFLARKDLKSFVLVSLTKLILISFLIVCFSLLLKSCIGFDYNTYVDVIKSVSQHRSGLDFNNISIDIYNGRFLSFDGAVRWTNFIYFCLVTSFLLYLTGIEIYISKYKVLWFLTLVFLYSIHSGFYFTTIVILLALIAALSVKVFIARHKVASYSIDRFFLIFILSSLVLGVVSMLTNYDTKSSDYPLIFFSLIGILIILDLQKNIDYFRARKVLHVFLICFFILFSLEGFTRFKLLLAGPPSNYQDFNSIIDDSFFNKLRTSEYHQDTLKSVDNALKKYKNEETSNRIVFGSRLEYLYAKYQMIPPRGLPLWWHINTSYQVRDVDSIDKVINSDSVKIIIFELIGNQPDTALMDEQTKASIFDNSHFYHDMSFSNLVVLVKK
jgi:nitrate reductase gamma subunit